MKKGWKIFGITCASIFGLILIIYLGGAVFFMSHFLVNTTINGTDFSMKRVSDVKAHMESRVKDYELTVLEAGNQQDTILGSDISLKYEENGDIEKALKTQNAFLWPGAFFSTKNAKLEIKVAYDEAKLNALVENMKCLQAEQTPPQSAYPKFNGETYIVESEALGTEVNREVLAEKIQEHIYGFREELDMKEEQCYSKPKYTSDSEEVKKACDTLNNYCKASITYTMTPHTEVVDKALISTWLSYDENMKVTFNQEAVTAYMSEFGKKYDTVGKTRAIVTPSGKGTEVSGGTYGWSVDEAGETQALLASIQNGEVVTKEPLYLQRGQTHDMADWGTTYIEVDLSAQHMWYVMNGSVALECDVVTGEPIPSMITPTGVYDVLYKQYETTLVGAIDPDTGEPMYRTPVTYWMPITQGGVGFHDADWQVAFGGTLNQIPNVGSHGCINMSVDTASALYDMVSQGTPAIVHY